MKKTLFSIMIMTTFSTLSYAQVGVNTSNPKQLFHIDGQKDNPSTGNPTENQALNDVVTTKNGEFGIGTSEPTQKLDVNGKTRVRTLPENGTTGYTATKTVVADANGVLGIVNVLPSPYNGYNLTDMQSFVTSKATDRLYTYSQIIGTCSGSGNLACTPVTSTVYNPVYTTTFNKKGTSADKYIFLSMDYKFSSDTIDNIVPQKSYWVYYTIEILINGTIVKTHSTNYNIASGAATSYNANKVFTINLSGVTLAETNNTLQIKLIPTENLMKANVGTESGYFSTSNSYSILKSYMKDLSFFLYEK